MADGWTRPFPQVKCRERWRQSLFACLKLPHHAHHFFRYTPLLSRVRTKFRVDKHLQAFSGQIASDTTQHCRTMSSHLPAVSGVSTLCEEAKMNSVWLGNWRTPSLPPYHDTQSRLINEITIHGGYHNQHDL